MTGKSVRAKHNKVRTGCLTCKARRKKCDETKPSCQRCTSTGRKCDGYPDTIVLGKIGIVTNNGTSLLVSNISGASISPAPTRPGREVLPRAPSVLVDLPPLSDIERHCHSFFQHLTAPRLALYFSVSVWHNDLIRCALTIPHPALFYSIAAVGAVHRRYRYGISREAFEYCGHAATLYKKAVSATEALKKSIAHRSTIFSDGGNLGFQHATLVAASETLLGIFQRFQSEHSESVKHLAASAKHLLGPPSRVLHSYTWGCPNPAIPGVMDDLACRLYCLAGKIFGSPVRLLGYSSGLESPSLHSSQSPMPQKFESLKEARDHVFTILEDIYRTRPCHWEGPDVHRAYVEKHESRLCAWSNACSMLIPEIKELWQKKAFNLMFLTRNFAQLMIHDNLHMRHQNLSGPEAMPDLPILDIDGGTDDVVQAACAVADAVVKLKSSLHSGICLGFVRTLVEGILDKHEILHTKSDVAFETDCVKPVTQTEASEHSSVEDVSESLALIMMIQKMSMIQHNAVIEAVRHLVPPHALDIEVACVLLEARMVLVRYYYPRLNDDHVTWVAEWWSF